MRLLAWALAALALAALGLSGCGAITFGDDQNGGDNFRRLYVNDKAPNDSLIEPFRRGGVKFVLQPGKAYALTVEAPRTADNIDVFLLSDGSLTRFANVPG